MHSIVMDLAQFSGSEQLSIDIGVAGFTNIQIAAIDVNPERSIRLLLLRFS